MPYGSWKFSSFCKQLYGHNVVEMAALQHTYPQYGITSIEARLPRHHCVHTASAASLATPKAPSPQDPDNLAAAPFTPPGLPPPLSSCVPLRPRRRIITQCAPAPATRCPAGRSRPPTPPGPRPAAWDGGGMDSLQSWNGRMNRHIRRLNVSSPTLPVLRPEARELHGSLRQRMERRPGCQRRQRSKAACRVVSCCRPAASSGPTVRTARGPVANRTRTHAVQPGGGAPCHVPPPSFTAAAPT